MLGVARFNSQCTATRSPYGNCVGIAYGRIISYSGQTYANGLAVATAGAEIAYGGLIYPYLGGGPTYVTWVGRVLDSNSVAYISGRLVATVGTPTDSGGYVIEGDQTVYA
jgi:uncharacterized Zn-binding protein involved in type VI secretion